jgi:hypothetical protein
VQYEIHEAEHRSHLCLILFQGILRPPSLRKNDLQHKKQALITGAHNDE